MKISGELVTLYTVYQGEDDMRIGHVAWYFANKYEADDTAKGRGWYGGTAPTGTCRAIKLDNGKYLILETETQVELGGPELMEEKRKNALAKLTESEKVLLGLN